MDRVKNYDEYFSNRRPASFAEGIIQFWHRRMFNLAAQHIPGITNRCLLEVGPGFGYFAQICKDHGINYMGIEMNANAADALTDLGYNVICSTIPPFPHLDKKVDVIWMSHVLEHSPDYIAAREILGAAYEKLSPGGCLVIICPDYLSWKQHFYDIDWSHGFPVTLKRLCQVISDVGFGITFSTHHTATLINGLGSFLHLLIKLIPVRVLDWISLKLTRKTFCTSFMSMFGWRQIIVIARK